MERVDISEEFNRCLDEIMAGNTIDKVLDISREHGDELKSLLETAISIKRILKVAPDPDYKIRVTNQLWFLTAQMKQRSPSRVPVWRLAWNVTLLTVLAVVLLLGSAVVASTGTMPDGLLYPVKIASEKVWLSLQKDDLSRLEYLARLTNERVNELIYLLGSDQADPESINKATQRLEDTLLLVENLTSSIKNGANYSEDNDTSTVVSSIQDKNKVRLMRALALYAVSSSEVLSQQIEKAPENVKPALERAINETVKSFDKAIKAIEQGKLE